MATLLMPLPDSDFGPTESGLPWRTMRDHGHNVMFATPTGRIARADPKMVTGEGLGILSQLLKADANGLSAYLHMEQSEAFRRPISAQGVLQSAVADFFGRRNPSARSVMASYWRRDSWLHPGKSVLYGKKTAALTKQMELLAWRLTRS